MKTAEQMKNLRT